MDDLTGALSKLLGDEETMQQLQTLASQLGLDTEHIAQEECTSTTETQGIPPELLQTMMHAFSQKTDSITNLLDAMEPVLGESCHRKISRAKRAVFLSRAAESVLNQMES